MTETLIGSKRLWIVADGEHHWVVAESAQEAIEAVRDSFDLGSTYEAEYEPEASWAPIVKPVRIDVTDNVRLFHDDYPVGTRYFCELMPVEIAEHMSGVVCSSVW